APISVCLNTIASWYGGIRTSSSREMDGATEQLKDTAPRKSCSRICRDKSRWTATRCSVVRASEIGNFRDEWIFSGQPFSINAGWSVARHRLPARLRISEKGRCSRNNHGRIPVVIYGVIE